MGRRPRGIEAQHDEEPIDQVSRDADGAEAADLDRLVCPGLDRDPVVADVESVVRARGIRPQDDELVRADRRRLVARRKRQNRDTTEPELRDRPRRVLERPRTFVLQNVAQAIFGSAQLSFPSIPFFSNAAGEAKSFVLGGATITYIQVFVVVVTVVVMIALNLFVSRTRMGRAMRASAQDKRTSALMGVNVNRVVAITFLIGSAMGALAGGLYGAVYHFAAPQMGFTPGLKAFIAAVLGGIGNIPGAFLGGILLGMIEQFGSAYISSSYRDAFAFIVLILLLAFKPSGLLGSTISQKA